MEIYNQLSPVYDKIYLQNIQNFQDRLEKTWEGDDSWFIDFYPSFGIKRNEKCDLLFYGQALKGWAAGFDVYTETPQDKILNSVFTSNKYFAKLSHTPLDWVNVRYSNSTFNSIAADKEADLFYSDGTNYRTFRSFFWNVVSRFTSDFYGLDRDSWDWSKKIVWSNLYKIAPDGENPNDFLCEQQLKTSVELVRQEIEELKPKYCIFLTNSPWWAPFKNLLGSKNIPYDKELETILSYEQFFDTKFIIMTRPFIGNPENHVSDLLKLIG